MTTRIVFCLLTLPFISVVTSGPAAAQAVIDRIAYDQCGPDLNTWEVGCDIHALVDGSDTLVAYGGVGPKWSPDGSRIAFTGSGYGNLFEILVANLADGSVANLTNHPAYDGRPAWSRSGRIAFVSDRDGPAELYVMDADGTNLTRLTNNTGFRGVFGWSSDGGRIAFSSDRDGAPELYVMGADGSNPTRLSYSMGFKETFVWSPDDGRIAFICEVESSAWDICTIDADGTNFVRLMTDSSDGGAAFSLVDGRLTFTTGGIPIVDSDGTITRVGTAGWRLALSPDGGRLAYVGTTSTWFGRCYFDEGAHNADDFCMLVPDIYVINRDGTGRGRIASGDGIDWFTPPPGQPVATFTYHCSGAACDFDGSGSLGFGGMLTSYVWQFGDGTSGSGATASHTYSHGQPYTVTLTVTNDTGATGSLSMGVYANAAPIAAFTVACIELTCTVDGSGSSDPDGRIEAYSFLFGDGQYAYGPTVTHTYATPGAFTVTLRVWDDSRYLSMGTQQKIVSVGTVNVNAPPFATFSSACNHSTRTCSFDAAGSSDPDGMIASYAWRFGDGTTGSSVTATRTYAAGRSYMVILTVTDNAGATNQTLSILGFNAPPVVSFTSACSGLTCSFNASGSTDPDGTIASYVWNFGDTTTGSGATVSHSYAADGAYIVTLTATDDGDATGAQSKTVSAHTSAPVDPAVEQVGFIRFFDCEGLAWSTGNDPPPHCSESVLMDPDGTHAIPMMPIGAWSPDGTTVLSARWVPGEVGAEIYVTSATGTTTVNLTNDPANDVWPAWSANGARIAFASDRDGPLDLYVMNADGSGVVRMATAVGMAWQPTWSPDGSRLAFNCIVGPVSSPWWSAANNVDICAINADGSGFARLTSAPGTDGDAVWSPDSTRLAFTCFLDSLGDFDICAINADGSGLVRLTSEPGSDYDPDWSPDGARILFVTSRYGFTELVVMNPDGSDVTRVSPGIPADTPSWSPDGTHIAFVYRVPWDPDWWGAPTSFVYVMNADGTGLTDLGWGDSPTWRPWTGGLDDRPVASFTVDCSGLTCTFDGLASSDTDGPIVSYLWQFADGTTGSGATVTHTFVVRRAYDFRLIVEDDRGAVGSSVQRVDLNHRPVASFTSTCIELACAFDARGSSDDGTIRYYAWSFGDGTWDYGATPSHTYVDAGTYTVTLRLEDDLYAEDTQSQVVTVVSSNVPPVALSTSTCSGLTCSFNASGSSDADGSITSYAWNFGDGATGSGVTATYTYAVAGTFAVTLTVTDNSGARRTHAQSVTVVPVNVPPVASFTSYCGDLMRCFDAHGSRDPDGTIASYAWSFGDGTTGSGVMAHHTYGAAGTYTVTLIVTDNGGATSQAVGIFDVNAPPVAAYTSTCIGLTCSFDGGGSSDAGGTIASYAWSFGDGTTGSGVTANHTYPQSGTFMVILIVTDNAAATSQTTAILNVRNAPPVASSTSTCSGLMCSFNAAGSSDPDGNIASYAWNFGDATTGSGVMATHTYAAVGTYAVMLTVTDNSGVTSTQAQSVTVVRPAIHVGDLDRTRTSQPTTWTAIVTILMHDSNHGLVTNAAVSGQWNNGTIVSCTTNANGQCSVFRSGILKTKNSVSLTVTNVALATFAYTPAGNHDPDGDSNGTTVTVTRQ